MKHRKIIFFPLHLSPGKITAAAVKDNWGCVTPLLRLNASIWRWLTSINWLNEVEKRIKYVCLCSVVSRLSVCMSLTVLCVRKFDSLVYFFEVEVAGHEMQISATGDTMLNKWNKEELLQRNLQTSVTWMIPLKYTKIHKDNNVLQWKFHHF